MVRQGCQQDTQYAMFDHRFMRSVVRSNQSPERSRHTLVAIVRRSRVLQTLGTILRD